MVFNTDIFGSCTGLLYCLSTWANSVTSGFFWTLVLGGMCVIIFMVASRYGNARAFGFAGVTAMFGGLFLAVTTLIPWKIASIFIIVGAIGIVSMRVSER